MHEVTLLLACKHAGLICPFSLYKYTVRALPFVVNALSVMLDYTGDKESLLTVIKNPKFNFSVEGETYAAPVTELHTFIIDNVPVTRHLLINILR